MAKAYRQLYPLAGTSKRIFKTGGYRLRVIGSRDGRPVVVPTNVPKRLQHLLPRLIVLDNSVSEKLS